MSAKLDWQIESDRTEERADTDPLLRKQRRQRQLGLFFKQKKGFLRIIGWQLNMFCQFIKI